MKLLVVLILGISLLIEGAQAAKCRIYHKVRSGDSLWIIAKKYRVSIKDIKRANPSLANKKYVRKGERICIPKKASYTARSSKGYKIYRVRPGDSLDKIAKKFGVSWKEIKRINGLRSNTIRVGQKLKIPVKKGTTRMARSSNRRHYSGYKIYRVRPGDSLQKIAKKFGVSWREIKRVNRLKGNTIRVGQKLKIPVKKRGYAKTRRSYRKGEVVYVKYRVRRGDSLSKIAKKFGVSWRDIKRANRLRSDIVRRGQILKIPVPKRAFERRYVDKPKINLAFLPVEGKYEKNARGVDIYSECGEKVRAVDSGTVIYSGNDLTPYGNMVIVDHTGYMTIYAYQMQNFVDRGDKVVKGEVLGKVGLKPGSGKCALHFEIRSKDGAVLNPLEYLGKK